MLNTKTLLAKSNKSAEPDWVTGLPSKNFLTHSRSSVNVYLIREPQHLSSLGFSVRGL